MSEETLSVAGEQGGGTGNEGQGPDLTAMADSISADLFPKAEGGLETGEAAATEKAAEAETKAAAEARAKEEASKAAAASKPAPKTWRAEAAAMFGTLPVQVQEEILKREGEMFRGLETYKQNAHIGKAVGEVIKDYLPDLQKAGVNPLQHIHELLEAHRVLSTGTPETKQQMFQQLAQAYGVYAAPNKTGGVDTYVDPQVAALQKEIAELKSKTNTREQRDVESTRATLKKEFEAFAADPAHPYLEELADDIVPLIKSGLPLKEAYETAVWKNPATRAKEQARLQAESAAKAKAEAEKRTAEAKRATGANVHTKPKPAGAAAPKLGSMEDTMAETLAKIRSRA